MTYMSETELCCMAGALLLQTEKLSTKISRKLLKIKIIIVYLQPVKMCSGM